MTFLGGKSKQIQPPYLFAFYLYSLCIKSKRKILQYQIPTWSNLQPDLFAFHLLPFKFKIDCNTNYHSRLGKLFTWKRWEIWVIFIYNQTSTAQPCFVPKYNKNTLEIETVKYDRKLIMSLLSKIGFKYDFLWWERLSNIYVWLLVPGKFAEIEGSASLQTFWNGILSKAREYRSIDNLQNYDRHIMNKKHMIKIEDNNR